MRGVFRLRPFRPVRRRWVPSAAPAGTTYTLTADPGSVSLSGTASTFAVTLPAASGSVSLSGTAATFGLTLPAAPGSVALTGTAATFAVTLPAAPGSVGVTGTAATFAVTMPAGSGAVTVSGTAATLFKGQLLAGDPGSVTLTGTAAAFLRTYRLVAAPGSVSLSGTAAQLTLTQDGASGGVLSPGEYDFLRRLGQPPAPRPDAQEQDVPAHAVTGETGLEDAQSSQGGFQAAVPAPPGTIPALATALPTLDLAALTDELRAIYLQQGYAAGFLSQARAALAADEEFAVLLMLVAVGD